MLSLLSTLNPILSGYAHNNYFNGRAAADPACHAKFIKYVRRVFKIERQATILQRQHTPSLRQPGCNAESGIQVWFLTMIRSVLCASLPVRTG